MLPILHLNGYKIAGPTVLARIPRAELEALLRGTATRPTLSQATDPKQMHRQMAATLDAVVTEIQRIQRHARQHWF